MKYKGDWVEPIILKENKTMYDDIKCFKCEDGVLEYEVDNFSTNFQEYTVSFQCPKCNAERHWTYILNETVDY